MPDEPLPPPQAYEAYIYSLSERYPFPRISSITASWRLT